MPNNIDITNSAVDTKMLMEAKSKIMIRLTTLDKNQDQILKFNMPILYLKAYGVSVISKHGVLRYVQVMELNLCFTECLG